jgi:glycosyltransferase involved in cell wall biosynthesis
VPNEPHQPIEEKVKLSIIIPVYQVEHTLRRCLDSVVRQGFRDWQLILVDDASTDGSLDICREYAQKDHRIQIAQHRQNQGLSASRNTGLQKAKGDYVTFIDSDDEIAKDTLQQLMEVLAIHPDYDLLEYPVYERYGNLKAQRLLQFPRREYTQMADYWLQGRAYEHAYAWNKVYRRELFRGLTYPEGRKFEDVFLLPQLLRRCRMVATTDVGLYYYYDNPHGITRTADGRALGQLLEAHSKVLPKTHDADYYAHVVNIALDVYEKTGRVPRLIDLPYSNTTKLKLKHLLGFRRLCQVNKVLHKFYRRSSR